MEIGNTRELWVIHRYNLGLYYTYTFPNRERFVDAFDWTGDISKARFFTSRTEAERTVQDVLSKMIADVNIGEHLGESSKTERGEVIELMKLKLTFEDGCVAGHVPK